MVIPSFPSETCPAYSDRVDIAEVVVIMDSILLQGLLGALFYFSAFDAPGELYAESRGSFLPFRQGMGKVASSFGHITQLSLHRSH